MLRKRNFSPRCALACCLSLLGERQLLGTIHPGSRHFPEPGESPNAPLPTPADPISHLLHDSDLTMRSMRSRALGLAPEQVSEPGQVLGSRPRLPHTPSHTHTFTPAFTHHLTSTRLPPAPPKQSTARSPRCCSLPHVVGGCGSDLAAAGQLQGSHSTAARHGQFCCFLPWSGRSLVLFFYGLHATKSTPLHQHTLPLVCAARPQLFEQFGASAVQRRQRRVPCSRNH